MKPISIIVAIAKNHAIGKNNQLLWSLGEDLRRFKEITSGHTIVMGKNTWFSLPKRPLPNRRHIVLTDCNNECFDGAISAYSLEQAIQFCDAEKENFIIGGGMIYSLFMEIATKLYVTEVQQNYEADTFFPSIDPEIWEVSSMSDILKDPNNGPDYRFITYTKIKNN